MTFVPNKTVAVITTGGTIGAVFGKGVTTLNHDSRLLKLHIEALSKKLGLDLQVFAPLNKFSEDMEPADWGTILTTIEECKQQNIKQIVITHGTDTLVYSAMATSLYYNHGDMKICFTCAFYPPSAPNSDAAANIEAALFGIADPTLPPDVYVAFSHDDKEVAIIRAQDAGPVASDKICFEPLYGETLGFYNLAQQKLRLNDMPKPQKLSADGQGPSAEQLAKPYSKVIQVACYPGLSLADLRLDPAKENFIVLEAYHCGTMPALALRSELLAMRASHPRTKVVLAMHPYRFIQAPYETTSNLAREGALNVYRDLRPHQLYVLAVCETARGKSLEHVLKLIEPWKF